MLFENPTMKNEPGAGSFFILENPSPSSDEGGVSRRLTGGEISSADTLTEDMLLF